MVVISSPCVSHARDCSRGLRVEDGFHLPPSRCHSRVSCSPGAFDTCPELAEKLIFSFRRLFENSLYLRAEAWVCGEPWNLWIQPGCGADLPGRLGTWSSDGFGTSTPNWRWVKEIHKNGRLSELVYSEEAQTFCFILKLCLGLFMTMWWQQNTCIGFFYPPVTHFAGRGMNNYISACFILPIYLFIYFSNRFWKSKRTQKLWNTSLVWGAGIFSNSRWDITQLVDLDGFLSHLDLV